MKPLQLIAQALAGGALDDENEEDTFRDPKTGVNTMRVSRANTPAVGDVQSTDDGPVVQKPVFSDRAKLKPPTREQMKEIVPRQGMFGIKGTLRDVLGVLGDSFLMADGQKAVYAPTRQREKAGDAMFGMTQGPAAMREAIERRAQVDPEGARKMMEDYQTDQYRQDNLESQTTARKDVANDRRYTNVNEATKLGQQYFRAAGDDPQKQGIAKKYTLTALKRAQADPEVIAEVEAMTPAEAAIYARGGITVQGQEVDYDRDAARQQKEDQFVRAESGRMARDNPPPPPRPGPQPRARTDQEAFFEIGKKPAAQRTQAEKDYYNRYINGTGGRTRSGRRSVDPGGTPSRVINGRTFSLPKGN